METKFSTAAQWTAPTAQRSHLSAASRVFVCATEIGATSPNLTYWLSPDRICIQSGEGGREGVLGGQEKGVGGTDQSQISCSRRNMKRLNPVRQAELPLTKGVK